MLVHEFLSCPSGCGEREDMSIAVDGEHITISCGNCKTSVVEYHGDFERLDGAP